jgi:hypothetical protein
VAHDSLNTTDFQMKESEHKALADQALADFAAREGVALDPLTGDATTDTSRTIVKSMGPQAEPTAA